MRELEILGHDITLPIPDDAVATEVVVSVAFQRLDEEDRILIGTVWGINSIPLHHALGLTAGTAERIAQAIADTVDSAEDE